jgi:hypothetical protein
MRHLVQQHLVNLVILEPGGQVPRDRDAPIRKVAQPGTGAGVIEAERPSLALEVQADERLRPYAHSGQLSHR